jgi:hypothetical protein
MPFNNVSRYAHARAHVYDVCSCACVCVHVCSRVDVLSQLLTLTFALLRYLKDSGLRDPPLTDIFSFLKEFVRVFFISSRASHLAWSDGGEKR